MRVSHTCLIHHSQQAQRLLHDHGYCACTAETRATLVTAWARSLASASLTNIEINANSKTSSSSNDVATDKQPVQALDNVMDSGAFDEYFAQKENKAEAVLSSVLASLHEKVTRLHGSSGVPLVTNKEHRRALYRLQRDLASTSKVSDSAILHITTAMCSVNSCKVSVCLVNMKQHQLYASLANCMYKFQL